MKGATLDPFLGHEDGYISIHAPVKGATRTRGPFLFPHRYFNPRSREGSDVNLFDDKLRGVLFQSTLP